MIRCCTENLIIVEYHVQLYTEPSNLNGNNRIIVTESISTSSTATSSNFVSTPSNPQTTSTLDQQVMLPLSSGCLTSNPGIPLIIVCCKVK